MPDLIAALGIARLIVQITSGKLLGDCDGSTQGRHHGYDQPDYDKTAKANADQAQPQDQAEILRAMFVNPDQGHDEE
jgi:hypothetical protein